MSIKEITQRKITIVDRPCGTGKTTHILNSFKPDRKYLVIVPLLSEVERVIEDASVPFVQPTIEECNSKTESLIELLIEGKNIVTTHQLYPKLPEADRQHLLDDYHIIIDEVLDVVGSGNQIKPDSFSDIYIKNGYVYEDEHTGKIIPTKKWDDCKDGVDDTLCPRFYEQARSGCLYHVNGRFFLWAMPTKVLTSGRSLTVYTYLAEGSMFTAYLKKKGIFYYHDRNIQADLDFRKRAQQLITIESIPSIDKFNFSSTGQKNMNKDTRGKVSTAIKNFASRVLKGIPKERIAITCSKEHWYKKGQSDRDVKKPKAGPFSTKTGLLNKTNWLPNTTRGTNDYIHVTHMIYLWDQHMNPFLVRWLEFDKGNSKAQNDYATSELIQWIYRSQVRKGLPITVYIPSGRMRNLLESWLDGDDLQAR